MDVDTVLRSQRGVISRRQVHRAGGDDNLIERKLRGRFWKAIHRGVYVDHTGDPTVGQAQQAAVLYAWPAALAGESALFAYGALPDPPDVVTVAIDHTRRVRDQPDIRLVRVSKLADRALWNLTPPRLRVELAVLHVAAERFGRRGEAAAVAVLADACQRRVTTPVRLCAALEDLPSLGGRRFLGLVLRDVVEGAYSVLEHRYLARVERAHALPRASRQHPFKRDTTGFHDVYYERQRLLVELDGRLGHEWASDQWADLERDLRSAKEGLQTVRLGWGAVSSPCTLARLMGQVLGIRGWAGVLQLCPGCPDN